MKMMTGYIENGGKAPAPKDDFAPKPLINGQCAKQTVIVNGQKMVVKSEGYQRILQSAAMFNW